MAINTNDVPVRDDIKATGDLNWMDFTDVGKYRVKTEPKQYIETPKVDFDKVKEKIVDIYGVVCLAYSLGNVTFL